MIHMNSHDQCEVVRSVRSTNLVKVDFCNVKKGSKVKKDKYRFLNSVGKNLLLMHDMINSIFSCCCNFLSNIRSSFFFTLVQIASI